MSGDVQPRKRKDKRRKKEGGSLGSIHEPISSHKFKRSESDDRKIFDVPDQGEKIHVQNDHGIGGNICVKIIFFCLFGLLVGAVGLIYMKSLGSTDVDLPTIEESRFAEYFTGWLDDSNDDHEHEVLKSSVDQGIFESDDHEEQDDQEQDNHEEDQEDHDDEEHENEDQPSVQDSIYKLFGLQSNEPDEEEESDRADKIIENGELGIIKDVVEDEEDNEEEDENDENDENDEVGEEEDEEENVDEEEINISGVHQDDQDSIESEKDEEDENDLSQVDEETEEEYSMPLHQDDKVGEVVEENGDFNEVEVNKLTINEAFDNNEDGDNNISDSKEEDEEELSEEEQKNEEKKNFENDDDDLGYEEINVSEEDLDENVYKRKADQMKEEIEEKSQERDIEKVKEKLKSDQVESGSEGDDEEVDSDFGGVAVKLGVGIALIIVAHLVLVKKWKSMSSATSDENASIEVETKSGKKEIENLHSSVEPVISRRQTLVPESVYLNTSYEDDGEEGEEEDEEEEEEEVEDEEYSEEECEDEFEKSNNWEAFEKPSWNVKTGANKTDEKNRDNEEFEEAERKEYGEDLEEIDAEEEEEEDYEDDDNDEIDDENDFVKQKATMDEEERQEEVQETAPAPPPRTRAGRGAKEVDEDFTNPSEELIEFEETSQDGPKADDETNNSGPEKQNTSEKKVGNEDEWAFRQELEFADEQFENNPKAAVEEYNKIILKKPTMARALIGRARALDHWAEKEKSNAYLKQAINAYKTLLLNQSHLLDDEAFVKVAERCIERMRFAGALASAIDIHRALILKYPSTPKYRNALAVTYLMLNKISQARVLLNETLNLWPEDGFALVHYGFILKTSDNNMEEGAKKLMAGIESRQEGVIDGMFFFHLGDALNRLGREQEAMKWYELGVKEGLFLSKYQRSLYNVNRLKGQAWWTKEETTYQDFFKKLEDNWREIRKEGLELLNSKGINLFKEEAENLKDTGDWKQLDLYFRGRKQANCNRAPITCSLVSSFKPASTCTRGQIKFSVMLPNTHVWPHCGPTNCRLRSHLGLVVPKKTFIRVAEETRSWEEGKFIIFDDSFEHEVWHNGTGLRLILIVDVWHPELTNNERRYLSPI